MKEKIKKNIENTTSQMRKGNLEFAILLIIAGRRKIYASDILKELKKSELLVVEGTLYPLLNRLRREEFLTYIWEESLNGPPRKYYTITVKGKNILRQLHKTWKNLAKSINSLLQIHEEKR